MPAPSIPRMKGVLICGGLGTRLKPLTEITNKSLLPVYDKPLVLYPLQTLVDAGIEDISIISGPEHVDQMAGFLGSGSKFNCRFSYRVQDEPKGIAHALRLAEEFVDGDNVCAILGDNIYFDDVSRVIGDFKNGGHVFLKEVPDVTRFGVAEITPINESTGLRRGFPLRQGFGEQVGRQANQRINVLSIEEKPTRPKSNYAVTGLYVYDARCFEVIKSLKPSARGELEITDVSNWYAKQGELSATILGDEWIDAGTFESLHWAAVVVRERKRAVADAAKKIKRREKAPA